MIHEGRVFRDGRFWLAEIPLLDAMTQGRTRAEALRMIGDWLETMVDRADFRAEVYPRGRLLLRRRREASGASLRDVASRLGHSNNWWLL
jgi:hypothetical protein